MDVSQTGSQREGGGVEEVIETLIVGVTEKGVLRKRSVKRKVTNEEKSKLLGFGNAKSDYDAIITNVLEQKMVRESVETLKERWKMVVLMSEDCMELVSQWETVRDEQQKKRQSFNLELLVLLLFLAGILLVTCWMLVRWYS